MNQKGKIIGLVILAALFLIVTFGVTSQNSILIGFDRNIAGFASTVHSTGLDNFMLSITKLCDPYEAFVIFLIFGIFMIIKKKKYLFYIFTIATGLGIILTEIIKFLVERTRPPMHLLMETGYSFPSAHATIAAVFLLSAIFLISPLLQNRFSKIVWLTICIIIFPLVAISRIYLSVHFTTDVLASIIIGCGSFLFADIIMAYRNSNRQIG